VRARCTWEARWKKSPLPSAQCGRGDHVLRPFILLVQLSLFDPTRAASGKHTVWAYCHVPNESRLGRRILTPADLQRYTTSITWAQATVEVRMISASCLPAYSLARWHFARGYISAPHPTSPVYFSGRRGPRNVGPWKPSKPFNLHPTTAHGTSNASVIMFQVWGAEFDSRVAKIAFWDTREIV
jgi:phytoene dehydrogenase-like protein